MCSCRRIHQDIIAHSACCKFKLVEHYARSMKFQDSLKLYKAIVQRDFEKGFNSLEVITHR